MLRQTAGARGDAGWDSWAWARSSSTQEAQLSRPVPRYRRCREVPLIVFAYDGSLNGDWIAHYAVRFAANTKARRLRLVHVHDASPGSLLLERIARIADECKVLDVALETELVPGPAALVAERLQELVPEGATLVCGTRARPRNSALLAGTVSSRLLEVARFPVVAIRVVHPGVLGQPGSVLLPLPAAHALPLLRLLGEDLHHLHVLFVCEVSRLRFRVLGSEGTERRLAEGRAVLAPIEDALREGLALLQLRLDSSVVVSDDLAKEILLQAAKHHARLICLEASKRAPIERILRDAASDVAVYRSPG